MARDTRATWAARVARWTSSGLSATAFAARERINPRTLMYWRWRLRSAPATKLPAPRPTTASFVEVVVPSAARVQSGMEIVLPVGYRVRLGDAVVPDTLRVVLDVLEARG